MRLLQSVSTVLFVSAISGCAARGPGAGPGAPEAKTERMPRNVIGGYGVLGTLVLNVEKTTRGDSVRYELFARWSGQRRVQVKSGESLVLTVDGQVLRFQARDADVTHDQMCGGDGPCVYDDRAYYPVTAGQLRAIAGAASVTVELIGSARSIEAEFNELNFARFRSFTAEHVRQGVLLPGGGAGRYLPPYEPYGEGRAFSRGHSHGRRLRAP